jgi:hypothetical protein
VSTLQRALRRRVCAGPPEYTSPVSVDDVLKSTFRNYVTLFFVVAALTVPIHVVHSFVYRDVVAVRQIHGAVEDLEPQQQVRRVSADDLAEYRTTGWLITAAEIALVPLLAGAARTVIAAGGAGSVLGGWRGAVSGWKEPLPRPVRPVIAVVVGLALAMAIGFLVRTTGNLLSEPVGEAVSFGPIGLTEGIARAAGAPFFLVPLALAAGRAKGEP